MTVGPQQQSLQSQGIALTCSARRKHECMEMGAGDMFLEREIQSSRYNLVEADVAVQRQLYELHRQEATRLAEAQVCCGSYSNEG